MRHLGSLRLGALMSNTYTKPCLTTEQVEKFQREGYLLPKELVFL